MGTTFSDSERHPSFVELEVYRFDRIGCQGGV